MIARLPKEEDHPFFNKGEWWKLFSRPSGRIMPDGRIMPYGYVSPRETTPVPSSKPRDEIVIDSDSDEDDDKKTNLEDWEFLSSVMIHKRTGRLATFVSS